MELLSRLNKVLLVLFVLTIPFAVVGCGGTGGGVAPKSESTGPEPTPLQRKPQDPGSLGN